jgi:hypothetical protein
MRKEVARLPTYIVFAARLDTSELFRHSAAEQPAEKLVELLYTNPHNTMFHSGLAAQAGDAVAHGRAADQIAN